MTIWCDRIGFPFSLLVPRSTTPGVHLGGFRVSSHPLPPSPRSPVYFLLQITHRYLKSRKRYGGPGEVILFTQRGTDRTVDKRPSFSRIQERERPHLRSSVSDPRPRQSCRPGGPSRLVFLDLRYEKGVFPPFFWVQSPFPVNRHSFQVGTSKDSCRRPSVPVTFIRPQSF